MADTVEDLGVWLRRQKYAQYHRMVSEAGFSDRTILAAVEAGVAEVSASTGGAMVGPVGGGYVNPSHPARFVGGTRSGRRRRYTRV